MNWINIGVLEACNWIAWNAMGRIFGLLLDRYCILLDCNWNTIELHWLALDCDWNAVGLLLDCYRIAIDFIGLPLE